MFRPATIDGILSREFSNGVLADTNAMARIGYLFLRRGNWNGQQILTQEFIDLVSHPPPLVVGLPVHQPDAVNDINPSSHYGVLWWTNVDGRMPEIPTDTFFASGKDESFIIVIPSLDIVVVRAGHTWRTDATRNYAAYDLLVPFLHYIVGSIH